MAVDPQLQGWQVSGEDPRPIHHALLGLATSDRSLLVLAYQHQAPHAAIAALLGISPETLQWRLVRALQAVRHAI